MATSSITENFIISGEEQAEMFVNALEASYRESLNRPPAPDMEITYLRGAEEIRKFLEKQKNIDAELDICH
ncbi:hypothetical protein [Marvinbryantia formatexigens]|nr:hypothetical protein [Marvinbryantia formatexigens]UWO26997.1 hypothetical protein NQ534_11765 [Marvinbryantia formatexigens DSM 14469]